MSEDSWCEKFIINTEQTSRNICAYKTITLFVFFLSLLKYLKNVWLIGLLINTRNVVSFLVSSMVLGFLNQLQTLWHLYLTELLGLLISLVLLELWYLIYPTPSAWSDMLVFFTNSKLMEFQVGYLALFWLFTTIDCFKWFWTGLLWKSM